MMMKTQATMINGNLPIRKYDKKKASINSYQMERIIKAKKL